MRDLAIQAWDRAERTRELLIVSRDLLGRSRDAIASSQERLATTRIRYIIGER